MRATKRDGAGRFLPGHGGGRPRQEIIRPRSGNERARVDYPDLGVRERCGMVPATERHHRDSDPTNNRPGNILRVCRRCHMTVDGRLERMPVGRRPRNTNPCVDCGGRRPICARLMCSACYHRWLRSRRKKAGAEPLPGFGE